MNSAYFMVFIVEATVSYATWLLDSVTVYLLISEGNK